MNLLPSIAKTELPITDLQMANELWYQRRVILSSFTSNPLPISIMTHRAIFAELTRERPRPPNLQGNWRHSRLCLLAVSTRRGRE